MPKVKVDDGVEISYYLDDFTNPWDEINETLVLAHGSGENSKFFIPMVPSFSRRYRVLRFDARGRGESTAPQKGLTLSGEIGSVGGLGERFVKDALSLVDQLGIEKIHWVGVSSGGITGALFAAFHPERIKSLVLCTTPYKFPADVAAEWAAGEKDMAVAIEKFGNKEWYRRANFLSGVLDVSKAHPKFVEWKLAEMNRWDPQLHADFQRWILKADLSKDLPKIKCPTLILAAEKSRLANLEQQRFMQQQILNAKLVILEGMGHGGHMLMTDRVVEEILKFLQGIR